MVRLDTAITGGEVVTSQGVKQTDVGILDGKVYCLVPPGTSLDATRVIDASNRQILPGCVDVHVHTRDPGLAHKEDFATLSHAAAAGGVTTIMCQPTTVPPISTVEMFQQVQEEWPKKSVVDFAIQAMADPEYIHEIPGLLEAGAISMEYLVPGATGPLMMELMKVVHENGGLSGISAGDGGYSQFMRQRLEGAGQQDISAWISAWPSVNEAVGISRVLLLTEDTPYRFHLHMVSTRRSVELLRQAKQLGRNTFSVETSPKYLLLTEEDHRQQGHYSTVLPRFKTKDDNDAVWEGLLDGTIDMVATDHAPHAREEKEAGAENLWQAPTGVPEVEISLPLMLTQVNKRKLSLPKVVSIMAEVPAREYGIFPTKGALQVGSDADVVIVDMAKEGNVDDAKLVTAPKYSAFGGTQLIGIPVMTLLRGEVVMDEGSIMTTPVRGSLVKPRR